MPLAGHTRILVGMTTHSEPTIAQATAEPAGHAASAGPTAPYGPHGPYGPDTRGYPGPPARNFRMRRSAKEKMLLGVCGGISEHTDIDPVYIRLAFLVSLFWGGIGIFAYIAAALVMPKPLPGPR